MKMNNFLKKHLLPFLLLTTCLAPAPWCGAANKAMAQKKLYIPDEWRAARTDTLLYADEDPDNKYTWSRSRSVESDNVIVLWDKYYGNTLPSKSPEPFRVDEQDLLKKCEAFYELEINQLGFVDPAATNLRNYKVMVLLNHTRDWVCYGGGYDFEVSALWLGPSACKPVGHSVAHEVGHSFQYMCYSDASGNSHFSSTTIGTGFHLNIGNGQTIWEQTAQWQAAQSYPELMYEQSIGVFRNSHNMAFTHEWHRYQSYWLHYYLCDLYNDITAVAQVWRQPMKGASDFNQALMELKELSVEDLYRLYYDYAAHCATFDFSACEPYREPYIGDFTYRCVMTGDHSYQVALASCPQSTGFNVIPLQVPAAGTQVTTHFTALETASPLLEADPAEEMNGETQWAKSSRTTYIRNSIATSRGFRLGYVALMKDGTRQYFSEDNVYCQGAKEVTEDVSLTVPEGVDRLWLIVSPAPKRYIQHKWTEKTDNAEQWPYRFELEGTDIGSRATVYVAPTLDGRPVADVTFTYDVYFPADAQAYSGCAVNVSGQALGMLGTAFQLNPADVSGKMQNYGPSLNRNRIMFYAANASTGSLYESGSTANGYGHWFNATGAPVSYGDAGARVYSEFSATGFTFNIGQYPGRCKAGDEFTVSQALRYRPDAASYAVARFVFNIHIQEGAAHAELVSTDYDETVGIEGVTADKQPADRQGIYTLTGQKVAAPRQHGIYIVNGKKVKL